MEINARELFDSTLNGLDSSRRCEECGRALSPKRLAAVPDADMCVPCLEQSGDVIKVRRLDENIGTPENPNVIQTYYKKPNQYLDKAISRFGAGASPIKEPSEFATHRPIGISMAKAFRVFAA